MLVDERLRYLTDILFFNTRGQSVCQSNAALNAQLACFFIRFKAQCPSDTPFACMFLISSFRLVEGIDFIANSFTKFGVQMAPCAYGFLPARLCCRAQLSPSRVVRRLVRIPCFSSFCSGNSIRYFLLRRLSRFARHQRAFCCPMYLSKIS